jgi:prepilin-type processing-associated H-X9-DG protein/prepilin-type N-terminal cleavage/methylation domain-containing protein
MTSRVPRDAGFGLTEVLAAAAIVCVLVAMLLPTVSNMRKAARSAQCVSNLRQVGVALNGYANDNGGRYPKIHGKKSGETIWMSKAAPYAGMPEDSIGAAPLPRSAGVFVCPEFPAQAREARETSYRYNGAVVSVWQYDRALIGSKIFLVVETEGINTDEFPSAPDEVDVARRHPGKMANFLFADGHVEGIREFVPFSDPRWGRTRETE